MIRSNNTSANVARQQLESFVANILEERGYTFVERNKFFPMCKKQQAIYTKKCEVGTNIYKKKRTVAFALYHPDLYPDCLVIQCRRQGMSGTVDEKYPFDVLNINQGEYDAIIILGGGGYAPGAYQWLKKQAGTSRLKHVFNQDEFQKFASSGKI